MLLKDGARARPFLFGHCLCCSARAGSPPKRKQSQYILVMLNGQTLNIVSSWAFNIKRNAASLLNSTELFQQYMKPLGLPQAEAKLFYCFSPFLFPLRHFTSLFLADAAVIWVPKRAQTAKCWSCKDDGQANNACVLYRVS